MAAYVIMRTEKRKLSSLGKIDAHHERRKEEYRSNPDIDPSRSHLNYHIIRPEKSYRALALERIQTVGARKRKDSVILQDTLVTATPEWILAKPPNEQAAFFDCAFEFFENEFGRENIISAVVHLDEKTPHMHLCFVPITKDGRLSSKEVIGGPNGLVRLQDRFYEHMHQRYPDLDRGISKKITKREHIPTYVFKNADELIAHRQVIAGAIHVLKGPANEKEKASALETLSRYAPKMQNVENEIRTTERFLDALKEEISTFRSTMPTKKMGELVKMRDQAQTLLRKYQAVQKLKEQIPPEVWKDLLTENRKKASRGREKTGNNLGK